jgi:hypothetical protein
MQRTPRLRAGAELLGVFFIIGSTGLLPAGVLYWLMRPTIVINPGLGAYQVPRPDPLIPRTSTHVVDSRAAPFTAKQQTESQADGRAAFAAVQKTPPEAIRKKRGQVRALANARRAPSGPAFGALGFADGIESK